MSTPTPPLGNLVRITPFPWTALPAHPSFPSHETNSPQSPPRPALVPFVKEVLDQALSFVDETVPKTFNPGKSKKSSPARASVQVLKRDVTPSELSQIPWSSSKIPRPPPSPTTSEAWFARRSRHTNAKESGTAHYEEFAAGLRDEHSEHEREYTPDVFDSYKVLDWDGETAAEGFRVEGVEGVRMRGELLVLLLLNRGNE